MLDLAVFDRRAHTPRKCHELAWAERLVVEEHHQVLEEGAPDRSDGLVSEVLREIHPRISARERTGNAL